MTRRSSGRGLALALLAPIALALATAASGAWPSDPRAPLALGLAARHADAPRLATDGAGGAIIAWQENEASGQSDVRIQRVDSTGRALWQPSGLALTEMAAERQAAQILT